MITTSTAAVDGYDYDADPLPPECYDEVPEGMEWVDGELIEKPEVTLQHAATQLNLAAEWRSYSRMNQQGGKVYTEASCRTDQQQRRPDVTYLTAELLAQFGQPNILPQSFPLIGEVASPDDNAEALFSKAREYLRSGAQEVWLLFPENQLVIIATQTQWLIFADGSVSTQSQLPGFSIAVSELFA